MGLSDATQTKESPPAGGKTCPNCGKDLKPGEGVRKENGHFCCDSCCERGPKPEKEKSKTCEFC